MEEHLSEGSSPVLLRKELRKMAKIEKGRVKISGHDIVVKDVLKWMEKQGRYTTSVEQRDAFNWKLRNVSRVLMRLLEKEGKVVIADHPVRKRSYCYGLPGMPAPTVETFAKPKPEKKEQKKKPKKETKKPKICPDYKSEECDKKLGVVACQAEKKHSQFACPVIEKTPVEETDDLVVEEGGEIVETKPEKPKPTNDPAHAKIQKNIENNVKVGKELTAQSTPVANPWQGR